MQKTKRFVPYFCIKYQGLYAEKHQKKWRPACALDAEGGVHDGV
jgi:hypothetical protein